MKYIKGIKGDFHIYLLSVLLENLCSVQGNLKGVSVVVPILPSSMEASYCESKFFHN